MTNEWQKFKEKVKNGIVEISRVSFEDADEQVFNKRLNIIDREIPDFLKKQGI